VEESKMKRFVILAPHKLRTGGPEACFQLSDSLIRSGAKAQMWLMTDWELRLLIYTRRFKDSSVSRLLKGNGKRSQIPEYAHYLMEPFDGHLFDEPSILVLPETYSWLVSRVADIQILLWWLSIDNAFNSLSHLNLNHLHHPRVRHAFQSAYAHDVVKAFGISGSMLSDYTVIPQKSLSPIEARPMKLCLSAGRKIIFDLDSIEKSIKMLLPEIEIIRISNMPRDQVYSHFSSSRLFLDLGNFPGKDRMVREALLLGCNVVVASAGAGRHPKDYAFTDDYRWQMKDTTKLILMVKEIMENPGYHYAFFETARQEIRDEKSKFQAEAEALVASFDSQV
jgi:hypothetical protein